MMYLQYSLLLSLLHAIIKGVKNLIKIESLNSYLEQLGNLEKNKEFYYRGENRKFKKRSPSMYQEKDLLSHASEYYNRLIAEIPNSKGRTPFETLSKLQHYEAKTRLLDITSNPLIALFLRWRK